MPFSRLSYNTMKKYERHEQLLRSMKVLTTYFRLQITESASKSSTGNKYIIIIK